MQRSLRGINDKRNNHCVHDTGTVQQYTFQSYFQLLTTTQPSAFVSEYRSLRSSMQSDAGWVSVFSVMSANTAFQAVSNPNRALNIIQNCILIRIQLFSSTVAAEDYNAFQSSAVTMLLPPDVQSYFFSYDSLTSSMMHRIIATQAALTTPTTVSKSTSVGSAVSKAASSTGGSEKMIKVGCVGVLGVVGAGVALL